MDAARQAQLSFTISWSLLIFMPIESVMGISSSAILSSFNLSQLYVLIFNFFFWLHWASCRIIVPLPGIELMPPTLEAQSHNHWAAREVPILIFYYLFYKIYRYSWTFDGSIHNFSTLEKQYAFSRNCALNFAFGSFPWPRDMQSDPLLMLGRAASHSSRQQCSHEGKQLIHLQPFCTQTVILFFTFSSVFNTLHEIANTLLSGGLGVRWVCLAVD